MQQTDFRHAARTPKPKRPSPERPEAAVPGPAAERRLLYAAVAIVLAAGAVRLILAALTPLVPDEAYYWEWSRRLAPGYFDHPPVVALLIRAGTALFGASTLGVRFFPVLAGVATMLLVVDLARRHGGNRAALYAAVISSCVPLAAAGLVLATPDTPLLLAYALALGALDRALAAPPRSRRSWLWWTLAGTAVGVGLASKYTAVLLPAGVLVAFLCRPSLRRRLRTPEPYVASAVALALFLPVVAWNAAHQWVSFAFQLRNGLSPAGGSSVGRVLELLASQLVLVSPILFVMLAVTLVGMLRRSTDERRFTLAIVALATFGFFVYSALRQRPEPNWPAPAYLPGFVLLSLAVAGSRWKRWLRAGNLLGAAMIVLIYAQSLHPVLPVPPTRDPMARGYGWNTLADAVHDAAVSAEGPAWIAANRYQDASKLAFHLPDKPVVFSVNLSSRPNQYDHWPLFTERARPNDSLVLVLLADGPESEVVIRILRPHFQEVREGPRVESLRGGELLLARRIWTLEGWRGSWPE
jgi:4-amino-4-deoxy-L-arabinose transferase-like glycosyltransferase